MRLAYVAMALFNALTVVGVAEDDMILAGYFPQWGVYEPRYFVTNVPAEQVTHVLYAFAKPAYDSTNNTGALVSADPYADFSVWYEGDTTNQPYRGNLNQISKLKRRFPHLRVLISAGGWTLSEDFSDIAASAQARASFAASAVSFMTNYSFDGVDLDWEYPVEGGEDDTRHRPDDATNFVLLVQALRSRLNEQQAADSRPYWFTVAAPCGYDTVTNQLKLAAMSAYVDWFNVMTYNYNGDWNPATGHNAPLYANAASPTPDYNIDKTVRTFLNQGVPSRKIVIGIAFYGIGFKNVSTNNNGLFQSHGGWCGPGTWQAGIFDYRDLAEGIRSNNFINNKGFVRHWDAISQVPYLYNPTSRVWISYDDPESIRLKVQYAESNALGGVMYWSIDADSSDRSLQRTCRQEAYPFRLRPAQSDPAGMRMSWYALTGQTYSVDCQANLPANNWQACQSLADGSHGVTSPVVGCNRRVTLTDTNLPSLDRRFYRIISATTAGP